MTQKTDLEILREEIQVLKEALAREHEEKKMLLLYRTKTEDAMKVFEIMLENNEKLRKENVELRDMVCEQKRCPMRVP